MNSYKTAKKRDPRFYVYQYNGLLSEIQYIKEFLNYKCNSKVFKIEILYTNKNKNTLLLKFDDATELKVDRMDYLIVLENGKVTVINEEEFFKNFELIKE